MAYEKGCNVVGIGHVKFCMFDGVVGMLTDLRHVLVMKKNLISLCMLHKSRFRYCADDEDDVLKVCKGDMTVIK